MLALEKPEKALAALVVVIQSEPAEDRPYVDYARAMLSAGEQPEAVVQALHKALEINPANWEARALLAEAYAESNEYELAGETFERVLESELGNDPQWRSRLSYGLSSVALQLGKPDTAIAVLDTAIRGEPENPRLYQALAEAFDSADLAEDALQNAREALRLRPDDLSTLTWFASIAVRLRAQTEAIAALRRAIELSPASTDLRALLGHTQISIGEPADAWETFTQIQNAENTTPEDLVSAAKGFIRLDDAHNAIACLEKSIALEKDPRADILIELSQAYLLADDPTSALEVIEQTIQIEPDNPNLQLSKADLLLELDRPQAAAASLQHALILSPENPDLYYRAALTYRKVGDLTAALEHVEKHLIQVPTNVSARYFAADLARALLQPDYARRILQDGWRYVSASDTMEGAPDRTIYASQSLEYVAYFGLCAELALESGENSVVTEALQEATDLSPEDPRIKALLARLAARRGDMERAERTLEILLETLGLSGSSKEQSEIHISSSFDVQTYLSVAEAAVDLRRFDIAIRLYQEILKSAAQEAYPHQQLARAIVLRAEAQAFAQEIDLIRHNPGPGALSDDAMRTFEAALRAAIHCVGAESVPASLARWQARGRAIFTPNAMNVQALAQVASSPDDVAAKMAALRRIGDLEALGTEIASHRRNPMAMAHFALSLAENDPREALEAAQVTADLLPNDPRMKAVVSRIATGARDNRTALKAIEEALVIWPDEARWHAAAATLLLDTASEPDPAVLSQAIPHLEQAAQLEAHFPAHHLALGRNRLRAGQIQEAIQALEKAAELSPDQPDAWITLARAHHLGGDLGQAMACAERVAALDPERIEPHRIRARIALVENKPDQALKSIQQALQIDAEDLDTLRLHIRALDALDRPAEALVQMDKALSISKDPLPLLIYRVGLIRKMEGLEAALDALRELNAGYSDEPQILNMLTRALVESGRTDEAIRTAKLAVRFGTQSLKPADLSYLHHLLGRLLRRDGQLDQAIHHLSEAIAQDPRSIEPYLELGQTYVSRREYEEALAALEQAISIVSDDHRPYYQAGLILKECKDYLKAESMLRRAAELSPGDLSIHRQLSAVVALNLVHNNREVSVSA